MARQLEQLAPPGGGSLLVRQLSDTTLISMQCCIQNDLKLQKQATVDVHHHHQGAVKKPLKGKTALSLLITGSGAWRSGEDSHVGDCN
jgi:hypothetical protein